MPNPVFKENTIFNTFSSFSISETTSHTITAGTTCVVVDTGGFVTGSSTTPSVTIDGQPMVPVREIRNLAGGQNAAFFVMTAADPNWPGEGTFDVVVTASVARQHKGSIENFESVLQVLNPFSPSTEVDNTDNGAGGSTQPPAPIASSTNDLIKCVTVYFQDTLGSNPANTFQADTDADGADLASWTQVGAATVAANCNFDSFANYASVFLNLRGTPTGNDAVVDPQLGDTDSLFIAGHPVDVVTNPQLGDTDSDTDGGQPVDVITNPQLGDIDSSTIVVGPTNIVLNPQLGDTDSNTQGSQIGPGEIFLRLNDRNLDPVSLELFDYFITDDWAGSIIDSGQFTTDINGQFTFTGLSAGTRWLYFRAPSNFFIANGIPFTVT